MRIGGAVEKPYSNPEQWYKWVEELGYRAVLAPVSAEASKAEKEAYLACMKEHDLVISEVGAWCSPIAFDEKVEGIACWIKELTAYAKAVKEEKDKLAERHKAAENRVENLKQYLMHVLNGQKFKTPKVTISYGKSVSVDAPDWRVVPEAYLKTKDPELDKTAIKKALQEGLSVPGASLVEKQHIRIK